MTRGEDMSEDSLNIELLKLKDYLSNIKDEVSDEYQSKLISHTLIGMIMTIHNLINTGAYDNILNQDLYSLVEESRNLSLHYGYFNEFKNIHPQATNIVESTQFKNDNYFASSLLATEIPNDNYFHISSSDAIQIIYSK